MTRRDADLEALQALAESIAEEHHGWRERRRDKAKAAAARRSEQAMVAPVRRRRRHRWVAGGVVATLAAGVATVVATQHAPPPTAPPPTAAHHRDLPVSVRLGEQAALTLAAQGRTADVFACQAVYDAQGLASVPGQASPDWRAAYLQACAGGAAEAPTGHE